MTPTQILHDINEEYLEYLEMMSVEEQFILIRNALAQKLAFEIAEKEHYKMLYQNFSTSKPYRINS